MEVKKPNRD